jgi:hypothetical protein
MKRTNHQVERRPGLILTLIFRNVRFVISIDQSSNEIDVRCNQVQLSKKGELWIVLV